MRRIRAARGLARAPLALAAAAASALLLSACGSAVGQGSAPRNLVIVSPGTSTQLDNLRLHTCLTGSLSALMYFTDGQAGNFTNRVVWSSSDTGTVQVSNGDVPVPNLPGRFYAHGTLLPLASGTATIKADYSGITQQLTVSVGPSLDVTVKTLEQGVGVVPANNSFRIGIGTTKDLIVTALLDGVETDISPFALWSFQAPNDSVATIAPIAGSNGSTGGRITGVGRGGPLVAQAGFNTCPLTFAQTNVSVEHVQGISLQTEYANNPPLIVGNTEKVFVLADLGNGPEQDISFQSDFASSNSSVLQFSGGGTIGTVPVNNLLLSLAPGGSVVGASFSKGGILFRTPTMLFNSITANLQAIHVTPSNAQSISGSLTPVQFSASGDYGGGLTQDITRQVTWASSNTAVATISNAKLTAGQALADTALSGSVTITATAPSSATTVVVDTDKGVLTVNPR